jgi:CubicO group peptidase (beta-lactamase class C family)
LTASGQLGEAGYCAKRFDAVQREFERNFSERGEAGASVCVAHDGEIVVDLWGGEADDRPWDRDTLVVVFSCTKGATALCAHMLADRGELDLDAPVARYWPAFADSARAALTVRMLLNHQAGLPGVSQPVGREVLIDFDAMVRLMEGERPLWRPGTRYGYHTLTFGWLVGEVVRRVSGQSLGTFFQREVAAPLGLDFWIGLPAEHEHRVARSRYSSSEPSLGPDFEDALSAGDAIQMAARNSFGELLHLGGVDAPGVHAAEIPAGNGITNARGLAGMYAPLSVGGTHHGTHLVGEPQLVQMIAVESAAYCDAVLFGPMRHSAGFQKASPGRSGSLGLGGPVLGESAFGHAGFGGAIGFADPDASLAFGYAMNRHAPAECEGQRHQPLIDAAYRSLGYRSAAGGKWR